MERLNAYSYADNNGNTVVDVEGMAVDLITVMKAGGIGKDDFLALMAETFDNVEVTVDTTNVQKN